MSDPRYADGDVVWCKCGGLFWPGEVKGLSSLPEEIREGFLRTPLVVVKFFDEDGYEFVLNENNIFPYNCPKKTDFIQKGLARFRSKTKEGVTEGWFAKFPKDVVHCETITGGNVNLLDEPPFAERKEIKVDYKEIFSDPAVEEKKSTKGKTPNKATSKKENISPNTSKKKIKKKREQSPQSETRPKITHPRFLKGGSDHEVRILTQASSPFVFNTDLEFGKSSESTLLYRCPMCDFSASRVNVVVLHSKSHSQTQVSYAVSASNKAKFLAESIKQKEIKPSAKKTDKNKAFADASNSSKKTKSVSTPVSVKKVKAEDNVESGKKKNVVVKSEKKPTTGPPKKPRLSKKEKEDRARRREEKQQELLMEWSEDEDGEAEEFKKIQESINQSLLGCDSSDDDEMNDVFKDDHVHHHAIDSDEEPPFTTTRGKLVFDRSGSSNSLATPESERFVEKSSPLPNKEFQNSRSSQPSPAISESSPNKISPKTSSDGKKSSNSHNKEFSSPLRKGTPSPFSRVKSNNSPSSRNGKVADRKESGRNEKVVQDLFDIDKALEETEVPEVPSLHFTKFSDFSAFKKKQKLLSKSMSPNKEDENENTSSAASDSQSQQQQQQQQIDDFDFDNNEDELFISPLKKFKRTLSPKPLPSKPEQTNDSPLKFSSLSAKAKAKQLARQAAAAQNKSKSASPTQPPNSNTDTTTTTPTSDNNDYTNSDLSGGSLTNDNSNEDTSSLSPENTKPAEQSADLTVSCQQQPSNSPFKNIVTPARNGASNNSEETFARLPFTPITAASLAASTLSPAPILGITQLSSPSTIAAISVGSGGAVLATPGGTTTIIEAPEGSDLDGGNDDQIYYMLVDDGAQLENQTILIDEAQLAAAGGRSGNVIIQDIRTSVPMADTSGGVAILPNHPSSSIHSQVPLITTPSGKTPIMISDNPSDDKK